MTSSIRWCAVVPSLAGGLEVYRGAAGIAVEFTAPDRHTALRLAAKNKLPKTVSIMSRLEFDELQRSRRLPPAARRPR